MSVDVHYIWCWVSNIFYCIKDRCRSPGDGDYLGYLAAPGMERFFCLHQTIYTLGALWIKSAEAGSGQLCICTSNPCIASARIVLCYLSLLFKAEPLFKKGSQSQPANLACRIDSKSIPITLVRTRYPPQATTLRPRAQR